MKLMTTLLALTFASATFAGPISGTVRKFSGRYVETGRPYAYSALQTGRGKLLLPSWIKADVLAAIENNKVTLDAEIEGMGCTDMSAACPSGMIINVRSLKVELAPVAETETFDGPVARFKGIGVTSRRLYNYVAVDAGTIIAIPEFLDADALLSGEAELSVTGKAKHMMCTDMSPACGPTKVNPLESVEVRL